jgi:hypothetical protein
LRHGAEPRQSCDPRQLVVERLVVRRAQHQRHHAAARRLERRPAARQAGEIGRLAVVLLVADHRESRELAIARALYRVFEQHDAAAVEERIEAAVERLVAADLQGHAARGERRHRHDRDAQVEVELAPGEAARPCQNAARPRAVRRRHQRHRAVAAELVRNSATGVDEGRDHRRGGEIDLRMAAVGDRGRRAANVGQRQKPVARHRAVEPLVERLRGAANGREARVEGWLRHAGVSLSRAAGAAGITSVRFVRFFLDKSE